MFQWLRLHASNAKGKGSIPVWEPKILHAVKQPKKKKDGHIPKIFEYFGFVFFFYSNETN